MRIVGERRNFSDALDTISKVMNCKTSEITNIQVLKKGMTNRSFLFKCRNKKYIMRIPGEGTDLLISRKSEAEVYEAIRKYNICDAPLYINPSNGYKITTFLEGVRACNVNAVKDLELCMNKLRSFHELNLQVSHKFDIYGQIDFYEKLRGNIPSVYEDYAETKRNVYRLRAFIESQEKQYCLCHIDSVYDNFLFYRDETGKEQLQLTDWEYAGMQDPHVDIAMFVIYALYNKDQIDRLLRIYFNGTCDTLVKVKIYCYIAVCGLLWSNWCEYKKALGVEFGEYSIQQYRYAKDFYQYAAAEMEKNNLLPIDMLE